MSGFAIKPLPSDFSITHNGTDGYVDSQVGNLWLTSADGYIDVQGDLVIYGQAYTPITTLNKPTGAQQTINWNNGNVQILSLASASGNVSVSFTNPMVGASYILKIIQHASSAKTIIWPAACLFTGGTAPTITATANAIDVVSLLYDGVYYFVNVGADYKRT